MDNSIIEEARKIGLRDADAYIKEFGGYPREGDADDYGRMAWGELRKRGADDGFYEACFEAWSRGFLGTRA